MKYVLHTQALGTRPWILAQDARYTTRIEVLTPTFLAGLIFLLLGFGLSFVRHISRRWRVLSEFALLVIGLALIFPPGLMRDPLFRSSLHNLVAVLVIGLLGLLIQRISGVPRQNEKPDSSEERYELLEKLEVEKAVSSDCGQRN